MKVDCRAEFVEELISGHSFSIVALQEINADSQDIDIFHHLGHALVIYPPSPGTKAMGFLLHKDFATDFSFGGRSERSAIIRIHNGSRDILCAVSHLPTGIDIIDYEYHICELDKLIPKSKMTPVFIGIDANAVIGLSGGEELPHVGPDVVGDRGDKGTVFLNWLQSRGLVASSTFRLDPSVLSPITRIPDEIERGVIPRQIDYVICDHITHTVRHTKTFIDSLFAGHIGSDHNLIACTFGFDEYIKCNFDDFMNDPRWRTPRRPIKMTSWKAHVHEDFQIAVHNQFAALGAHDKDIDLPMFSKTVVECAKDHGSGRGRYTGDPNLNASIDNPLIHSILSDRRNAETRGQRKALTRQLWQEKKKLRHERQRTVEAKLLNAQNSKGRPAPCFRKYERKTRSSGMQLTECSRVPGTECEVGPAAGGDAVSKALTDYFTNMYSDNDFRCPRWFVDSLLQHADDRYLLASNIFSVEKVTEAISNLKGNTSGSEDGVLAEMLWALPTSAVNILAGLFADRFIDEKEGPCVNPWSKILVVLIPKCLSPSSISDFRPISVISVLCKTYLRCISNYIKRGVSSTIAPNIHGYRAGYQTLDEIQSLRQVIEKCNEWDISLCFAKTDIIKAYDLLKTETIIDAFRFHNIPNHVTFAILREWHGQKQTFSWGTASSDEVQRRKGMPQGDPLAPLIFNMVTNFRTGFHRFEVEKTLRGRTRRRERRGCSTLDCLGPDTAAAAAAAKLLLLLLWHSTPLWRPVVRAAVRTATATNLQGFSHRLLPTWSVGLPKQATD